jgi:transketolase
MGVNDFGASAPGYALQERFGLTPDRVAERALHLLAE